MTVTTTPKISTSSAANCMGSSAGLAGTRTTSPPGTVEALDRGLLAGDAGDDDVALGGRGLGADDHVVAVEDPGVDHGLAPDPEHEQLAVTREVRPAGAWSR